MSELSRYSEFVEHPRYGREPRFTKLVPQGLVYLGWHRDGLIPCTAVKADISKQKPSTFQVTHYYDLERKCCDCGRFFIFFALEQKHWYEVLRFGLDSDCIRCVPCRKKDQRIEQIRRKYEELFHIANRSADQSLTMAEYSLYLIENDIFTSSQTQRIRMLLNEVPDEYQANRVECVRQRLRSIERSQNDGE